MRWARVRYYCVTDETLYFIFILHFHPGALSPVTRDDGRDPVCFPFPILSQYNTILITIHDFIYFLCTNRTPAGAKVRSA